MKFSSLIICLSLFLGGITSFSQVDTTMSTADSLMRLGLAKLLKVKVTTASKKEEQVEEAPGLVTVISKEEIEGFAAVNLGQVLQRVVNTSFLSPDVFMNNSYAIRGQELTPYNNHVLFLLNGRPIRDPITGGFNSTFLATFPLTSIQQIEVIRGPGSVLYGSTAYSGVVNVITKKQLKDGLSGQGVVGYGSYNQITTGGNVNVKKGELEVTVGLNYIQDQGSEYGFYDYDSVYGTDNFHQKGYAGMLDVEYKGFRLMTYLSEYKPYSMGVQGEWTQGFSNNHLAYMFDLGYEKEINEKLSVGINYTRNAHNWSIEKTDGFASSAKGRSNQFELQSTYCPTKKFNVLVGGGVEQMKWGGGSLNDGTQNSLFAYTQLDYSFHSLLKLIGGLQYNKIEGIDASIVPRLGLISNFTKHFGAKVLYSEAYRRAYPLETSFAHIIFKGTPDLVPETIKTFDVQLFFKAEKAQTSISYYNSMMSDLIKRKTFLDFSSNPPFYKKSVNQGEFRFWGVEYEGKYSLHKNILLTANASYQKSTEKEALEDDKDAENGALHPNLMVKIGVLYHFNRWNFGVFNNYISAGYSPSAVNPHTWEINNEPKAVSLLSAKICYELPLNKSKLKFTGQLFNLLNQEFNYTDFPNKKLNTYVPLEKGFRYNFSVAIDF